MTPNRWEAVIGLEIHVQLLTQTKMFCGNTAEFGAEPNSHVCPVCLGLPGALPVINAQAVQLGVCAALGLNCTVHETSVFARKNYFYPDLPKGYQITQFDRPLATEGWLDAISGDAGGSEGRVRIRRIHLEEDAGKSIHDRVAGRTAVDLNRAGVPLIEIVTEPDLHTPEDARSFLGVLKRTLEYLEVSDCDMEKGSLRVDANVSVRPAGSSTLGTKTEVKNMNSFANVEAALRFEIGRQQELLERGGSVVHETLLWDAARAEARPMRSKEESHDYRYFPEPDLPALIVTAAEKEAIRRTLPETPKKRARRFQEDYGLPAYDAEVLTASREVADFFEAVAATADPKAASNWVMTEVLAWVNQHQLTIADYPVQARGLGELLALVGNGTLSTALARQVLARMIESGRTAAQVVESEGLVQVRDSDQLEKWVEEALADHPAEAARLRSGEERLLGFFMGQVMRRSRGKADPRQVTEILRARLLASETR